MTLNDYINSIKDKRICVIGIGISNEPLIRLLAYSGCNVTACDKRSFEQLGATALELISMGAKLKLGESYLDNLDFDIIFRTPGLMPFNIHPVNPDCIITSEMELFFALCPCRIFAVTGSDGKTTTTTIISELLKASGYNVHLGGNIGKPLLCEVPMIKSGDVAVLELSSFQLHSMVCSPDVAVITNISPNHLDKHKSFQDYVDAKKQIFANRKEGSVLVLNADDSLVSSFGGDVFFSFAGTECSSYVKDGKIYRDGRYVMDCDEVLIPGEHNIKNYLAAFAATIGWADDGVCREFAKTFRGVEHRLETVRVKDGVTFINDSIGSSPTRTIAGLHALKTNPVVIVGGYDKDLPFDLLGRELKAHAKAVVVTGATKDKIAAALDDAGAEGYFVEPDFDTAVMKAVSLAQSGDTVLFSPACASFDRFKNFEERGKYFKKIIMDL